MPLVPDQLLKLGARFAASERLTFGADVISSSGSPFRGDEGNLVEELEGYTLLNLRAEYRIGEHARLFANIDNALDEEYETFGVFGTGRRSARRRLRRSGVRRPRRAARGVDRRRVEFALLGNDNGARR